MKPILLLAALLSAAPGAALIAGLPVTFANPTPAQFDQFGVSVAAVGPDRVLIGAPGDGTGAASAGSAYLFTLDGIRVTSFHNPAPAVADRFGSAVAAVGEDKVLLGAPAKDIRGARVGAAYLFGTEGTLLTTFKNPTPEAGDSFGAAVAALGADRVLVAAPGDDTGATDAGAVYLYHTDGTLLATFANPTPGAGDGFGGSIAAVGSDRVLIGAQWDDTGVADAGAAYLLGVDGTLLATFDNPAPGVSDWFGVGVAALGETHVVIGAHGDDSLAPNAGSVHLFTADGRWVTSFANPAVPETVDGFGARLAAMGTDKVLVGALMADTGAFDAGAAYLFRTNGTLLARFANPNPAPIEYFGGALAVVGGNRPLIGAYGDNVGAQGSGAAYLFDAFDGRPSVMTLSAGGAGPGEAMLQGWVNPQGSEATAAWFEWGVTTQYGNRTALTDVGGGSSPVTVSLPAGGLVAGSLHHFRIVASNSLGVVTGPDRTFPYPFPMAWTGSPAPVTATGATLHGTVSPDGWPVTAWFTWRDAAGTEADSVQGTVFRISARTNAVPLSQPVTGLLPGRSHVFELRVVHGDFSASHSGLFTTPLQPVPITLSGSSSAPTNATLQGAVNPNSLPTRFWFEWGTTTNYGNSTPAMSAGSGDTSLPVTGNLDGLSGLTPYHYRLVASNAAGVFRGEDKVTTTPSGRTLDGYHIAPTLVPPNTDPWNPTPVTATALGHNRFDTEGNWRVRLTRNGQPTATLMEIVRVRSRTAVLNFPSVDAGFYGFLLQASNSVTRRWEDVYESGPRFFQVGQDTTASTYSPVPRGEWTEPTQPRNFLGTAPAVIHGTISGVLRVPQRVHPSLPPFPPWEHMAESENSGLLHLGWTKDFPGDGEDLAGVQLDFHFPMEGEVVFRYSIPFRVLVDVPTHVYSGQDIELKVRDFQFNGGSLTAEHHLAFSTYHGLWLNAPYDLGFPAVENEHLFQPDRLEVWGRLPVAPFQTASYGPWDSAELPWSAMPWAHLFDDGRVEVAEIAGLPSYVALPEYLRSRLSYANITLGGSTSYASSGTTSRFWYGPHEVWTEGPDDGWQEAPQLWHANADLVGLTYVSSIPYYSQAAAPLFMAGVELGLNCGVSVRSRDVIHLKPPLTHGLKVRIPAGASGSHNLVAELSLPIDATFASYYLYRLSGGVYFDMPRIRRKDLGWSDDDFWRPEAGTNVTLAATFTLNTTVSVTNRSAWTKEYLLPVFAPLRAVQAGSDPADIDYDLVGAPPAEAEEERRWVAAMAFQAPPPPPMVPQIIRGSLPGELASGWELMLGANPAAGAEGLFLDPPPDADGYPDGAVVTLTARPARGYRFTGWSGDITGTENPTTLTLDADRTVIANFTTATLGDFGFLPDGSVRFSVGGFTGLNWVVQTTTNLASPDWVNLVTNSPPFTFTQPDPGRDPQRFYRVLLLP